MQQALDTLYNKVQETQRVPDDVAVQTEINDSAMWPSMEWPHSVDEHDSANVLSTPVEVQFLLCWSLSGSEKATIDATSVRASHAFSS